jgi:hypothetical protein
MSISVDKALTNSFINADFGIAIAHENKSYAPVNGTPYAQITVFDSGKVGASLSGWDQQVGIFQVVLRYPENKGAIQAKTKAEAILSHFKLYSEHSYEDQDVVITSIAKSHGHNEDGWFKIVLRMNFKSFTPR